MEPLSIAISFFQRPAIGSAAHDAWESKLSGGHKDEATHTVARRVANICEVMTSRVLALITNSARY